jgi:hypothetical protein
MVIDTVPLVYKEFGYLSLAVSGCVVQGSLHDLVLKVGIDSKLDEFG